MSFSHSDQPLLVKILDARWHTWGLPAYSTDGAAAFDLRAALDQPLTLHPGETAMVSTGLAVYVADPGLMALALPRSGLGTKGLVLGNLVGLIDSDYQGAVMLQLWNRLPTTAEQGLIRPDRSITIQPGDRIAQMVLVPVVRKPFQIVESFPASARAAGGFGHTGTA